MEHPPHALALKISHQRQLAPVFVLTLLLTACWTRSAVCDTTIVASPDSTSTSQTTVVTQPGTSTKVVTTPADGSTQTVVTSPATSSATIVSTPAASAAATVVTEPNEIVLESLDKPVNIRLQTDAGPITAEDIRAARLLIDGQEYADNVNIQVVDGKVSLVPDSSLPPGRYTLLVDTARGQTEVMVYNPSPDYPRTISRQATILGVSEPELESSLGRTLETPARTMALNLKPVYYQGQTILADMDVDATHYYSWRVNGKEVKYGQGDHTFVYTFKSPGTSVVTYTERDGNMVVASGIESVDVVSRPVLVRKLIPGKEVSLTGPEGYSQYTWKVDGEVVASGQTLTHLFPADGKHSVEVIAEDPTDPNADAYQQTTYNFVVNAQ